MAVATHEAPSASAPSAPRWARRPRCLEAAAILGGVALAVLVDVDGSPGWQLARATFVAALTSLLVVAQLWVPPRWRGPLAVLAGVPAVAIAAGFAPHWGKGGPMPVQAAAAALAVAGASLTIGGMAIATQGRRWPRRLAHGGVVFVGAAIVAFVVGPAVAATNVPRPQLGATPASVGLAYEDVTLRTADGVTLAAWYIRSTNRAAVILLHGAGSTRTNVLDEAAVLTAGGFGVLMVDARGHGDSGGRAMDFGWDGDADIAAATTFLSARSDVDRNRIGVVGMSMGGEEALGASGSNNLIRAVVAEGATARSAADEAWLSDQYGLRGRLQELLERIQDRVTDVLTRASVPRSGRAAVQASGETRYLLVAAGEVPDEAHAAAYVAAGAPDRVEIWVVSGSGHTDGLQTAPDEWRARVIGFLSDVLLADLSDAEREIPS